MEQLIVITNVNDLIPLADYLLDKDVIAVDTESTGLSEDADIIGISLCAEPDIAYYIVLSYWDKEQQKLIDMDYKSLVGGWIENLLDKQLVMHNAIFDCRLIRNCFGIDLMPYVSVDTLILGHLLNENRSNALKELATNIFGSDAKAEQKEMAASVIANGGIAKINEKSHNIEIYKADSQLIGKYGAKDALLTFKLMIYFLDELKDDPTLWKFFFDDESMPLLRGPTYALNTAGFKVDTKKLDALEVELNFELLRLEERIQTAIKEFTVEIYPGTSKKNVFNINSNDQLSWLLFIRLGLEFKRLTQKGRIISKQLIGEIPYSFKKKKDFITACKAKGMKPEKLIMADKVTLEAFKSKFSWISDLLEYKRLKKLLNTYVEGLKEKIKYGVIKPSFLQHGTTSGRYSSSNPNCLSMSTQVLTEAGFKYVVQLQPTDKVACFDPQNGTINFARPNKVYISNKAKQSITTIKNQHINFRGTDNHRFLLRDRKTMTYKVLPAHQVKPDYQVIHSGISDGQGLDLTAAELKFLIAVQADSEIRLDNSKIRFVFTKKRKYIRLIEILSQLQFKYEDASKLNRYEIKILNAKPFVSSWLSLDKCFTWEFLQLSFLQRKLVLDEIMYWDGSFTRKQNYSSSKEQNVDIIQAIAALSGVRAHKRLYKTIKGTINYQLDFSFKDSSLTTNAKISTEQIEEQVWCLEVNTGFFVTRRGSDTLITGNCQNLPRDDKRVKSCLIARPGKVFVGADHSQLEPRVFASFSQDIALLKCFEKGEDFYSVIGAYVFDIHDCSMFKSDPNSFAEKHKGLRQIAKVIGLSVTYGTTAYKMVDAIKGENDEKYSIEECQKIISDYLEAFPGVKSFMDSMHLKAIHTGESYSLYGRPRRIPEAKRLRTFGNFKHDRLPYELRTPLNLAVNHSIQSTSASILNRGAIQLHNELKRCKIEGDIVLQVHDSLVVECREDQAELVVKLMKTCMEDTVKLDGVKLIAEPKIGKTLAEV